MTIESTLKSLEVFIKEPRWGPLVSIGRPEVQEILTEVSKLQKALVLCNRQYKESMAEFPNVELMTSEYWLEQVDSTIPEN
jgi:hypothetical protein